MLNKFGHRQLNQRHLPDHIFNDDVKVDPSELTADSDSEAGNADADVNVDVVKTPTFLDLFYPKTILFRSLNMFYQWFSVTMCYYGLSYASTSLLGDPYTNFSLSVFIEIPGSRFSNKTPLLQVALAHLDKWHLLLSGPKV